MPVTLASGIVRGRPRFGRRSELERAVQVERAVGEADAARGAPRCSPGRRGAGRRCAPRPSRRGSGRRATRTRRRRNARSVSASVASPRASATPPAAASAARSSDTLRSRPGAMRSDTSPSSAARSASPPASGPARLASRSSGPESRSRGPPNAATTALESALLELRRGGEARRSREVGDAERRRAGLAPEREPEIAADDLVRRAPRAPRAARSARRSRPSRSSGRERDAAVHGERARARRRTASSPIFPPSSLPSSAGTSSASASAAKGAASRRDLAARRELDLGARADPAERQRPPPRAGAIDAPACSRGGAGPRRAPSCRRPSGSRCRSRARPADRVELEGARRRARDRRRARRRATTGPCAASDRRRGTARSSSSASFRWSGCAVFPAISTRPFARAGSSASGA